MSATPQEDRPGNRIVYVNGAYLPEAEASVSIFDRGFLMGDAVYEVTSVIEGRLIDNAAHLARLARSLEALSMKRPATDAEITGIQRELVRRNALSEGGVYLQVTRGVADRSFEFPDVPPTLVMFTQARSICASPAAESGIRVALTPELRWARRDIKTTNLLPASWSKHLARLKGADDAWFVEDGAITEGSSNNAFIVTAEGALVTPSLGHSLLPGVTRRAVLRLAELAQIRIEERSFTPEEAKAAREAFSTSASSFVQPVVQIDDTQIGDGKPGPIARRLRQLYIEMALAEAE